MFCSALIWGWECWLTGFCTLQISNTAILTQGSQLLGFSRFKNHKTGGEHVLVVQLPASGPTEGPFNWPEPQLCVELEVLRKP